jgi:hypothetical protein
MANCGFAAAGGIPVVELFLFYFFQLMGRADSGGVSRMNYNLIESLGTAENYQNLVLKSANF